MKSQKLKTKQSHRIIRGTKEKSSSGETMGTMLIVKINWLENALA